MSKKKNIRIVFLSILVLTAMMTTSCNTTKRLAANEMLLVKNEIKLKDQIKVDKDALFETIKQHPNRKILGIFPFYVWAYNVPNPEKFDARNEKRRAKLAKKNEKRREKGKKPLEFKPFGSWWRETVGEAPVVYDSSKTKRSRKQLETYLIKHGWFDAEVETKTRPGSKNQTVIVTYIITGHTPYVINSLAYNIPDTNLLRYTIESRATRNTLRHGSQFNIDKMDAERELLNSYFRNLGYYNFYKELIYFDADSSLNTHAVDLTLGIIPRKVSSADNPDSTYTLPYKKYKINAVKIIDRPYLRKTPILDRDTTVVEGYFIIDQHQLNVKPKVLAQNVLFKPGNFYQLDEVTRTYRRLSSLPIVRATSIDFTPVSEAIDNRLLNAEIGLTPSKKQNISFTAKGTNRGGFFGLSGSVGYQNKNIFGSAEVFEFNITGRAEAQQLFTGSSASNIYGGVNNNLYLNTVEIGPEISLTFPKFLLPIKMERFAKSANPRTKLTANLSYQRRPDYERTRSFGSISYQWSETEQKDWAINPLEISLIKIQRSPEFDAQLAAINDPFLTNSFQDHFIVDSRVTYTLNTQELGTRKKNFFYYHGELESAGSILRGFYQAFDAQVDSTGSYQVLGIDFAQYLKTVHDFRYYRIHNEKMSTAYRITGGIGVPLKNLDVLPFEKSFFGGGANDIRAWQARTLGPGSYRDPEVTFDKIGDILLEANVEYRFKLIGFLEGAFFVDAGNIWTLNADEARPGADFEFNRFLSEIAFGAGTGFRFNFDFFLVRLDIALQVKDPALTPGERWIFQPKDQFNTYIDKLNDEVSGSNPFEHYSPRWNFNLGIGYPF